jgi:ferritin-like metal-binding protein YciE
MATQITDPRELFLLELGEMLSTERILADQVLPQIRDEVQNAQLRQGIEMHQQQSREHAQNIERAFQILGEQPRTQDNPALQGLRQSHDQMIQGIRSDQLRDLFDAGAIAKTEHLEIAAYHALIAQAQQMGQPEVQQLLETNCSQDQQTLQRVEQMSQQMTRQIS